MEIGEVQTDLDDSEWVVIGISFANGQQRASRVRRNSLAHHVHAESSPRIAQSLDKEVDETATTSEDRPDTAG
jgi:hypothetical protein